MMILCHRIPSSVLHQAGDRFETLPVVQHFGGIATWLVQSLQYAHENMLANIYVCRVVDQLERNFGDL